MSKLTQREEYERYDDMSYIACRLRRLSVKLNKKIIDITPTEVRDNLQESIDQMTDEDISTLISYYCVYLDYIKNVSPGLPHCEPVIHILNEHDDPNLSMTKQVSEQLEHILEFVCESN